MSVLLILCTHFGAVSIRSNQGLEGLESQNGCDTFLQMHTASLQDLCYLISAL